MHAFCKSRKKKIWVRARSLYSDLSTRIILCYTVITNTIHSSAILYHRLYTSVCSYRQWLLYTKQIFINFQKTPLGKVYILDIKVVSEKKSPSKISSIELHCCDLQSNRCNIYIYIFSRIWKSRNMINNEGTKWSIFRYMNSIYRRNLIENM